MGVFAAALAVLVAAGVVGLVIARDDNNAQPSPTSAGLTGADFHSLVADPAVSGRLFVGGHQAVSVSDDGGTSWQPIHALDDIDAMGWGFATDGIWISGHPGIVFSTDGGETVRRRNGALPDSDIHALGVGAGAVYAAGPRVGLIASRDDGATWQDVNRNDGTSFFGRILVDGEDPRHLLAADATRGPVVSIDGGKTWDVLTAFPADWISAVEGFQWIYASGPEGAVMSGDGGTTWNPLILPAGASLVEADPQVSGRLYSGVHDGDGVTVFVSANHGREWRPA